MTSRAPDTLARRKAPGFFWQGVLIVLPVVLLAGAGFHSLRLDRRLARHEAILRAQTYADDGARLLWSKLTAPSAIDDFRDHTFRVNALGELLHPPAAGRLPPPQPLDLTALDDRQRDRWLAARSPDAVPAGSARAVAACREFLELNPPEPFAALAQYRLGLLLAADGKHAEALASLGIVIEKHPASTTESGVPLPTLAHFKRVEFSRHSDVASGFSAALDSFCSNIVTHPTYLTPLLLEQAAAMISDSAGTNVLEKWRDEWERHKPLRLLASAALSTLVAPANPTQPLTISNPAPAIPTLFWFHTTDFAGNPQSVFPPGRYMVIKPKGHRVSRNTLTTLTFSGPAMPMPPLPAKPASPRAPLAEFQRLATYEWLATRLNDGQGGFWIVCRAMDLFVAKPTSPTSVTSPAWLELRQSLPVLPTWFDYSLELAGASVSFADDLRSRTRGATGSEARHPQPPKASSPAPEVLASARHVEDGVEWLRVNVRLVAPEKLFAAQRTRTWLFGLLVGLATVTAVIGFVSAWRSFHRQQHLARMQSNFVSSVSHELRAPLASVRLMAESLDRGKVAEPGRQREYYRFIVQECRRLGSLIENVLDFARIEQGRKQYEFEPTDIAALVQQTVKLLEPVAAERQVILVVSHAPPSDAGLHPSLDGAAIQQALVNLLDNAIKHSPPGTAVNVRIQFDAPRSTLSISVADSGPGIPPAEHARIFERFYRPGSEMRRETQGVGIGLSIVKHIVEAHHGQVRVESDVGQGSRFTIELPLASFTNHQS